MVELLSFLKFFNMKAKCNNNKISLSENTSCLVKSLYKSLFVDNLTRLL